MTPKQFELHKNQFPKLSFTLIESRIITHERDYTENFGIHYVYRHETYLKGNGKTCYVDTFIKSIKVDRSMLTPCKNGYEFRIKKEFFNQLVDT